MNAKEIYLLGVWSIIDELKKSSTQNGNYTEGLVRGIEIGLKLSEKYSHKFGAGNSVIVHGNDETKEEEKEFSEEDVSSVFFEEEAPYIEGDKKVTDAPSEPKFHRTYRVYDLQTKKDIVRESYDCGFDLENVRIKYNILGKGTIPRWIEMYSEELGLSLDMYKDFINNKKNK